MFGKKKEYCENSSDGVSHIGVAQCYKGDREVKITILYDEHGIEKDTLKLCKDCADRVEKDARKHGNEVNRRRL